MTEMIADVNRAQELERLLRERIVILDGAMGTMIQAHHLDEAAFRGDRFKAWKSDLKGNNDLLNLTQPRIIEEIHRQYLEAGADIIETNTFNSTGDFAGGLPPGRAVHELNVAGARNARAAADAVMAAQPGRICFVAGAIGPTTKTASLSPDVNNPAFRAITFDQLVEAYGEQMHALLDGGVDLLLVETVFDTLNSKAALFAIDQDFEEIGTARAGDGVIYHHRPQRAHALGPDGRGVLELHLAVPLLSIGINCALGPKEMRPLHRGVGRHRADIPVSTYPNAGLPNPLLPTGFPETPEIAGAAAARVGGERLAQHRRRLLRHHAGAHPGAGRGGAKACRHACRRSVEPATCG